MDLQQRIHLLSRLGGYLTHNDAEWQEAVQQAEAKNPWFTEAFTRHAANQISKNWLTSEALTNWANHYHLDDNIQPKNIGLVLAGNIPMVGIHDVIAVFLIGHFQTIKLSAKDDVLIKHLVDKLIGWDERVAERIRFAEMLKGCDAYIATGGNNSSRYFEYYFQKYPHIIRKSKTSVAVITGNETADDLSRLADDIHLYYGRGCRNITKLFVPEGYDFIPLLDAFAPYRYYIDNKRYKNNYDFQLSVLLLNQQYYMTNGTTLLVEAEPFFTPISMVHYSYYKSPETVKEMLENHPDVQFIAGAGFSPFGRAQSPELCDYADGVDTMQFLLTL